MFGLVAGLYDNYMAPAQLNILLVGQERVGKTTLLERVKVTEFSKTPTTAASKTATPSNRRRFLCPAPGRYASAKDNDNDENDDEIEEQQQQQLHTSLLTEDSLTPSSEQPNETNRQSSMEDIPIDDDDDDNGDNCNSSIVESDFDDDDDDDESNRKEYDLKPGARMLPKAKIRPTIGMNLAKLEMCTAKCHFWDLGGKMKDIRKRYYADADAVVCIVPFHISSPQNGQRPPPQQNDRTTEEQHHQQVILLEELQTQLSEFVPILVFVNIMGNNNNLESAQYHQSITSMGTSMATELQKTNPNVRVMVGSAKTGQGVRSAFEWLIPVAKQQKVKK
eukprot:CAMPEP_0195290670 /NCGR_PEP_ID=MMETSP0707-20130614/6444_1 /TAXON_ID=33640 /ORGANISM="Asterionellopsis glacialis, Strain CCMP134" /LENGTH=334 /DNA_ID=CAMNT_0040350827 /DNA_START=72 /DNA_END=1073 /DNA_ORIENTATION=+